MLKGTIGMMTKEEVFERAKEYDFDAVKTYLEQGGNPLIFDEAGSSLIALLLWGYYKNLHLDNEDFNNDEELCKKLKEYLLKKITDIINNNGNK